MSSEPAKPLETLLLLIFKIFPLLVVLFSLVYFIIMKLLKYVMRSRNHAQMGQGDEVEIEDPPSIQFQRSGFEPCVMQSLPMHQFKVKEGEEQKQINTDCAICLGEFEEGEWLKHLPNCSHGFHVSCVDEWFQSHSSCPLCRTSLSL